MPWRVAVLQRAFNGISGIIMLLFDLLRNLLLCRTAFR